MIKDPVLEVLSGLLLARELDEILEEREREEEREDDDELRKNSTTND